MDDVLRYIEENLHENKNISDYDLKVKVQEWCEMTHACKGVDGAISDLIYFARM